MLCVVHCETPSGTLNDCSIGPIARARGVLTLVDCVASLGGMPSTRTAGDLDLGDQGFDECLSLVGVAGAVILSMLSAT